MPGKGRMNGTEPRNSSNMYEYNENFVPTTVGEEYTKEGWLRTTTPEGSAGLNPLITSGMRGQEDQSPSGRRRRSMGGFGGDDGSGGDGGDSE